MFTMIKGAKIYAPEKLGVQDLLISGEKIVAIGKDLDLPTPHNCEVLKADGEIIFPGFIDTHVHFIGSRDSAGLVGRTFDVNWNDIVEAGVTTAVGVLGSSYFVRSLEQLYLKAMELDEMGITAYIYTGSFHVPPPTLTGSVRKDVMFLEKVKGVKTSISEQKSSHRSWRELAYLASETAIGASIVGKGAVVHVHVGKNTSRLDPLFEVIDKSGLPFKLFVPTHVNTVKPDLVEQGIEYAKKGGTIDLSSYARGEAKVDHTVKRCLASGVPIENITISSDANIPLAIRDKKGERVGLYIAPLDFMRKEIKEIVNSKTVPLSEALKMVTTNPARVLDISDRKGSIKVGMDADFVISESEETLEVEKVYAKGKPLVIDGRSQFQGHYQNSHYSN